MARRDLHRAVEGRVTAPLTGLSSRLVAQVAQWLSEFAAGAGPSLRLPVSFGGHAVSDATRSDFVSVLVQLIDLGIGEIEGIDLRERALSVIGEIDPAQVEGFWSYRVAEATLGLGGLAALPSSMRSRVVSAADSPVLLEDAMSDEPQRRPNYLAVAARCLHAQSQLNGTAKASSFEIICEQLRVLLTDSGTGWIADSRGVHRQYDVYTPDIYILLEPLAAHLDPWWRTGLGHVARDLDDLALPAGAVVWGRSSGLLALAMTIELGGILVRAGLDDLAEPWLARMPTTLDALTGWFDHGVTNAHLNRGYDAYRGPARRLQLTFDIYGKLLATAGWLRSTSSPRDSDQSEAYPPVDRLVRFATTDPAAAWVYRSRNLSFVLPLMRGQTASYTASPRSPGLFDQPVAPLPVMVPIVVRSHGTLAPLKTPEVVEQGPGRLVIQQQGWGPIGADDLDPGRISGHRTVTYEAHRRTLAVHEELCFDDNESVTVLIPSVRDAALQIAVDPPATVARVDVSGMAEWATTWGQVDDVREVQLPRAHRATFSWSLTAPLRIGTTEPDHQYSLALYGPMSDRSIVAPVSPMDVASPRKLRGIDVFHMAWPERWSGTDPERTRAAILALQSETVPIVWTQHNLVPHRNNDAEGAACYSQWAQAASVVIHHTGYGLRAATDRYEYGPHTRHVVIPHGHWGAQYDPFRNFGRAVVERDEGWPSTEIRLAVIGQPRREKHLQMVVDAVARSTRRDIQLVARLDPRVEVPEDSRIIAYYGHLTSERYHRRMMSFDGVILPFGPEGLLATGTAFDCIGAGLAPITTNWEFFREVFGARDICFGETVDDLTHYLDSMTLEALRRSSSEVAALRPRHDWSEISARTFREFERASEARSEP